MEWISVEDKYPNKTTCVLAWGRWGNPEYDTEGNEPSFHVRMCHFAGFDIQEGPIWKLCDKNELFYCVTHWMPLPNQPERLSEKTSKDDAIV